MRQRAENWLFLAGVVDQIVVAGILTLAWNRELAETRSFLAALLLVPFWTYLHRYFGLYDSHRLEGWRGVAGRAVTASTVGLILASAMLFFMGLGRQLSDLAAFALAWLLFVLLSRAVLYTGLRTVRRRGADRRYVCIIGDWNVASEMASRFRKRPEWGLHVSTVGVGPETHRKFYRIPEGAGVDPALSEELPVAGGLEDVLRREIVDEILIVTGPGEMSIEQNAIELCKKYGVQCRVRLLGDEIHPSRFEYSRGSLTWMAHETVNPFALAAKRSLDLALSAVLLLAFAPLLLVLTVLVKLSSPGPVFFLQRRVGLRGREFVLIKFRTMIVGAESMLQTVAHRNITGGPAFKDTKDLRVTPFGRILRRFSLDELPQLINVLKGDMSLVGPRPLPVHESSAIEGEHRRRFSMRPGITCRWQVQGRSEIGFAQWMQLDIDYVDNWSLLEDLKLLLLTVPAVLTGKGAY